MISVITPTYNRAKYLGSAIESVLAQTYSDLELIIIDDNAEKPEAREETERVVNSFKDSRIRYVKNQKNLGGAESRNVGIKLAQGSHIAFLDDDDLYLPDRLEVQYKQMIEHDWDVSVMDGATYIYETEEKASERHQRIKNGMTKEDLIRVHLLYHISGTNTFMYKTSFLQKIGGFENVPSCQEYFLMQKTLDHNPSFGYIPEIHIKNYNHRGEQVSTGPKKLAGQMMLIENKKKYFHLLTLKERKQVLCRHHGVLFFVHYKMHNYLKAFKEAVLCFISSPKNAWKWYEEYKGKING